MKLQNYSDLFMRETQNGFRKGRSCTDPTFCLKLLIEKRREFNLETHLLFIDYEKAFDNMGFEPKIVGSNPTGGMDICLL